jgi:hypothetical protein
VDRGGGLLPMQEGLSVDTMTLALKKNIIILVLDALKIAKAEDKFSFVFSISLR